LKNDWIQSGIVTDGHGCNAQENVASRFPATLGSGDVIIDLSCEDFGMCGTGGASGAGVALPKPEGDGHNGKKAFRRRGVGMSPVIRKNDETTEQRSNIQNN
jgi:hypothetical protein